MKITKTQLKQIIKEELNTMPGALTETDQSDMRLRRLRKQRQTVSDLAAITSLASLEDTPAAGGPESPQVDIENALDLLKNAGPGTTFQVIEALQAAIEKLEGQEEPRDPHAHPQGSPHWTEY